MIRAGVIERHPLYRAAVAQLTDAEDIDLGPVAEPVSGFALGREPPGASWCST